MRNSIEGRLSRLEKLERQPIPSLQTMDDQQLWKIVCEEEEQLVRTARASEKSPVQLKQEMEAEDTGYLSGRRLLWDVKPDQSPLLRFLGEL